MLRSVSTYWCSLQGSYRCTRQAFGTQRTKKCAECGAPWASSEVYLTAQEWRGDGRYTLDSAVKVFTSLKRAETFASAHNLVVRTVPK